MLSVDSGELEEAMLTMGKELPPTHDAPHDALRSSATGLSPSSNSKIIGHYTHTVNREHLCS